MSRSSEAIFHEARDLAGDARQAYLAGACGDDVALRSKVEALLLADAEAASFLETVGPNGAAEIDDIDNARDIQAKNGDRGDRGNRSVASSERAGITIGRYKLLQAIGEGGFGTVWMAEQKEPFKRRVALKIIKLGMDTKQVIARFEAERQALAMMEHPNIAKVLDAGSTETGRPYFVMEYVRGVGILEYCDTEKLDTTARLGLFMKVCNAIQHAHQKGIIHRDIKPSNVMVTLHDGVPVPKVIDFGVAKATNTELTQKTLFTEHRQMIGTPAYMSPEQAEMSGLDIDTRSDVYSLGVLLYELLTGTTPFDSKSLMQDGFAEMMRIIREQEPHKPSTRLSTLGESATRSAEQRRADVKKLGVMLRGDLDWIVMKCLERDRTRRYDTANGLAADIKRHLDDEPVVAGPPRASYKLRKFLHRNRAAVSVAATIVVFLIAGLSLAMYGLLKARASEQRAHDAQILEAKARADAEAGHERARNLLNLLGGVRSIAVLPLANASGDPEQEYFAEGVTRSLINALKKVKAIDVKSFESVAKFIDTGRTDAEIAHDLEVDLLLTGSMLRIGNQVQINVSLDHPGEGLNLWSDTYPGDWSNVFDLQRQVSEATVRAVQVKSTQQDRERLAKRDTSNAQARDAYFKGMYILRGADKSDTNRALTFFDDAIRLDSDYALAYLGKADAYLFKATLGNRPEEYNEPARQAALKALELDDTLAGAWAAIGNVRLNYDWDWDGARQAFETALELDPYLPAVHAGLGNYYVSIGEFDLSIEHLRKAIQIDSASLLLYESILYTPFFTRRMDVAIEFCQHALDLDDTYWSPYAWMGLALAWDGDVKAGIVALEEAYRLEPKAPIALALLASVYAMDGQTERANQKLDELLDWADAHYVCPYEIATVFVALGDFERAIEFVEHAEIARSECIPIMAVDLRMDVLRDEPGFNAVMERVGHPLYGKPSPWRPNQDMKIEFSDPETATSDS